MKNPAILILVLLVVSSFSSQKFDKNQLSKIWILNKIHNNDIKDRGYIVSNELNKMGMQFFPNGKLKVMQSARWCPSGETEIKYETVEGKWRRTSDSTIVITHPYRGSKISEKLLILKLTDDELHVKGITF